MPIDPNDVPRGTVVQTSRGVGFVGYLDEHTNRVYSQPPSYGGKDMGSDIARVFVPVPDGMTVDEAAALLDQHKLDPDRDVS